MSSSISWRELFTLGKWGDCAQVLNQELTKHKTGKDYSLRIIYENNKFVCEQLSKIWDCCQVEKNSLDWASSHKTMLELVHITYRQHTCSELPMDVILCVASNAIWWSVMKVDPLQQHFCCKETLRIAYSALKAVSLSCGIWNVNQHSTGFADADFLQAIKNIVPCLLKLSPILCYLSVEIILLGLLNCLDEENHLDEPLANFLNVLNELITILPQIRVHITEGTNTGREDLVKFSWLDMGEYLNLTKLNVIVEVSIIVAALICIRERTEEKTSNTKALYYLSLLDGDSLSFSALIHYTQAFAYFREGKMEKSLLHLQQTSFCASNIFLQSRLNVLKGQILINQNKPAAAMEVLQAVDYKHMEVQIPMCAYLISKVYEKLGKVRQQCTVLDLLAEYMSTEPSLHPKLLSPLSGMEHRILLAVHIQPEISYDEVLKSSAKAHLSVQQPRAAAEKLMELLHVTSINLERNNSFWHMSELLHDTAAAFLEADSFYDAQQICEAAIEFFSSKSVTVNKSAPLSMESLQEDIIGLLLLARSKELQVSSDVSSILNRCAKLLQSFIDKICEAEDNQKLLLMCRALLARVYLQKALVNVKKKFVDDAVACFHRALHWKNDDPEVIIYFIHTLLENEKFEESLALWGMYREVQESHQQTSYSIALNYLLGKRMPIDDREEIICRLQSLSSD